MTCIAWISISTPDEPIIAHINYTTLTFKTSVSDEMFLSPLASLHRSLYIIPVTPVESLREEFQIHEPIVFLYYRSKGMRTYTAHDMIGDVAGESHLQNIDHFHMCICILVFNIPLSNF